MENKIIVIGSTKGGCGKSTFSQHLAAMHERLGGKVVLVDADRNAGSAKWAKRRGSVEFQHYDHDKDIAQQLKVLKERHKDSLIVVDCGGYDSRAMRSAVTAEATDIVIIPTKTTTTDLDNAQQFIVDTAAVCRDNNKILRSVLSEVRSVIGVDKRILGVKATLEKWGSVAFDHYIGQRDAYHNNYLKGGDGLNNEAALEEVRGVYNEIKEILK